MMSTLVLCQIVAEEINESNEIVQLVFHGKSLDKKVIMIHICNFDHLLCHFIFLIK